MLNGNNISNHDIVHLIYWLAKNNIQFTIEHNMDKNDIYIPCEICEVEPASEIQGGLAKGERKLWFCCKSCKDKIINERRAGLRDRRA